MNITIDREKYAKEIGEPEELLEPIPQCALQTGGARVTDFKLMQPTAPKMFEASFEMELHSVIDGCLVRYGEFPPCAFAFAAARHLRKHDNLIVCLEVG